jgi:hypothetical protein
MSKQIGPSFLDELRSAGVSDWRFVWFPDGTINFDDQMPQEARQEVLSVYDAHVPVDLNVVKRDQVALINAAAQSAIDDIMSVYPDFERLTWATQADEARAWQAAAEEDRVPALVPWCANAAANRLDTEGDPMPLSEFMARVSAKADAYKTLSSQIAGKRQSYEDAISAATTVQAVKEIVWE